LRRRARFRCRIVSFAQEEHLLISQDVTGAERVEAMRRDFVANVSHELRTPLTVLSGFLETIQDLKLDAARVRDYVSLMAPQAERMKRLIEDLLALSALEYATAPPPTTRVPVRALLERIRAEAEALSGGRHRISLALEAEHDLLGSETEIASAFINLATNAVRYTPKGGDIRLSWRSNNGAGEFTVEDTGIGIESEHIPRLTERFYRVDRSRSRETGGPGWAFRSSSTCWCATRPRCTCKANSARAAASARNFRQRGSSRWSRRSPDSSRRPGLSTRERRATFAPRCKALSRERAACAVF
jgi:two-component system phosphate regulon sensor histidine kinase PhoR